MRTLTRNLGLAALLWGAVAAAQSASDVEQTPTEVFNLFLESTHVGDYRAAAELLSLEQIPPAQREKEGKRLARRLMFLLDQHLILEPDQQPAPTPGATVVTLGELPLHRLQVPVEFLRQPPGTTPAWRFSPRTVRAIDALFTEHGSPVWEVLPQALLSPSFWVLGAWQWVGFLLLMAGAWLLARLVTYALTPLLARLARFTTTDLDDHFIVRLRGPARAMLFLVLVVLGTRALAFPARAQSLVDDVARAAVVAALVWGLLRTSRVVAEALQARAADDRDVNSSRSVKTQVSVLHRVVDAVVLLVGGAMVLLQFPGVRHIGMSMLASAGVAGVVIGLAAQRSISNLLAGIQISLTQPIRIGDTVIIENEWGWIEEITLTYVVVKIWDLRRLVVPIGSFLEKPFQNWSRSSTEILGTIEVFADYRVDVNAARVELARLVEPEKGKLWNGKVQAIQVTDLTERTMKLRALISADDSGKAWDLRCLVREGLVAWLRAQPEGLPRIRTEGGGVAAAALRAE